MKKSPFHCSDEDLAWVERTYDEMSLDERIGQLFFMACHSFEKASLDDLVERLHIGGIMFRTSPAKSIVFAVNEINTRAQIPLLISANMEAGGNGLAEEGTKAGSNMMVSACGSSRRYAAYQGRICAEEMKALGGNFAFAPVSDIDMNFRNPIMNTRTYGDSYHQVLRNAKAYWEECQKQGIGASAKHFPGDGVDERDQHLVTSVNSLSCRKWDASYGRIYRGLIEAGVPAIMVGHIALPAYVKEINPDSSEENAYLPASLSKELLKGLLRGVLGFNGLILSDATTMGGFSLALNRDQAVPACIENGCDMFLFTKNLEEDVRFMKEGYQKGLLSEARLKEAVWRILAFKASLGLRNPPPFIVETSALSALRNPLHQKMARTIAERSITLVKQEKGILPLDPKKNHRILLHYLTNGDNALGYQRGNPSTEIKTLLEKEGFEVTLYAPPENRREGMQQSFEEAVASYDLILYLCNLATKSNQTSVRIEWENPMGINLPVYWNAVPTLFISTENPYHLLDVPRAKTFINTYGVNDTTCEALIDKLMGRSPFVGVSPIDPFCGKKDCRLS